MSTWTQVYGVLRIDLGVFEEPNAVELFKEHRTFYPGCRVYGKSVRITEKE